MAGGIHGLAYEIGAGFADGAVTALLRFLATPDRILDETTSDLDRARARRFADAILRVLPESRGDPR